MMLFLKNLLLYFCLFGFQILSSAQNLLTESLGPTDAILSHNRFQFTSKIFALNKSDLVLQTNMINVCA